MTQICFLITENVYNLTILFLEPYLNTIISGTEQYRALKLKIPKGKFVKTQYVKGH